MKDVDVAGDLEPLLSQEGLRRSSISMVFFKFIGAVLLASAACYLFIGYFNAWTPETENRIFFVSHSIASFCHDEFHSFFFHIYVYGYFRLLVIGGTRAIEYKAFDEGIKC